MTVGCSRPTPTQFSARRGRPRRVPGWMPSPVLYLNLGTQGSSSRSKGAAPKRSKTPLQPLALARGRDTARLRLPYRSPARPFPSAGHSPGGSTPRPLRAVHQLRGHKGRLPTPPTPGFPGAPGPGPGPSPSAHLPQRRPVPLLLEALAPVVGEVGAEAPEAIQLLALPRLRLSRG